MQSSSSSGNEYLRQLADTSGLYNLQKRNEHCTIEDLVIFASLTSSEGALLDPRLRRHFSVVHLPGLSSNTTYEILSAQWMAYLRSHGDNVGGGLGGVSLALAEVCGRVCDVLRESDTFGRAHYLFSLKQLESVCQVC